MRNGNVHLSFVVIDFENGNDVYTKCYIIMLLSEMYCHNKRLFAIAYSNSSGKLVVKGCLEEKGTACVI